MSKAQPWKKCLAFVAHILCSMRRRLAGRENPSSHQTGFLVAEFSQPSRSLINNFYLRDLPATVQNRGLIFGPVHPHHQNKLIFGAGSQFDSLSGRARVLNVQIYRAVRIGLEILPGTDAVAVNGIGDKEVVLVVHRQRPETLAGGSSPFLNASRISFHRVLAEDRRPFRRR